MAAVPSNDNTRYVLKNSLGITYCIWYKNGLYMSMLENDSHWGPPFLLSENATADFSALIDSDDSICTTFVDYSGRLLHITACEERKDPVVLLESRISGSSPYEVNLVEAGGTPHIFYIVSHNRKQLLTYQRIEKNGYSMPEVEGVITRDAKSYSAASDGSAVHLFFVTDVQNVNLLVHRKINADGKAQKPNTTPFPYNVNMKLQSVVSDTGAIFILASGEENTVCFRFDPILNRFSKALEVFSTTTGPGMDSLLLINNSPYAIRTLKNGFILMRIKNDNSSLGEETRIDFTGRDIPLNCRYLSNAREDKILVTYTVPILFGNGLKFPFDFKSLSAQRYEKLEDDREVFQERIRELENRIEYLENSIREMLRP